MLSDGVHSMRAIFDEQAARGVGAVRDNTVVQLEDYSVQGFPSRSVFPKVEVSTSTESNTRMAPVPSPFEVSFSSTAHLLLLRPPPRRYVGSVSLHGSTQLPFRRPPCPSLARSSLFFRPRQAPPRRRSIRLGRPRRTRSTRSSLRPPAPPRTSTPCGNLDSLSSCRPWSSSTVWPLTGTTTSSSETGRR